MRKPVVPILPLREQYQLRDKWLKERLDLLLPEVMARAGIDMWVVITDEYNEDPVTKCLLPSALRNAVGKMILVFTLSEGKFIKETISRPSGIEDIYINSWYNITDTDWKGKQIKKPTTTEFEHLKALLEKYQPKKIGINVDRHSAYCDGLSHTNYSLLTEAIGSFADRLVGARQVSIGFMEARTQDEIAAYKEIVPLAHSIIADAYTKNVITPGVTTNDDVRFYMMQRVVDLGLDPWFDCTVGIFRKGMPGLHNNTMIILPGDLIHCDFGFEYLGLHTDTQELCYIPLEGESAPPAGLVNALKVTNRLQDIVMSTMAEGKTGNQVLAESIEAAKGEGIVPQIYTHPLGVFGHAPGAFMGSFSNQGPSARGDYPIYNNTAYSLELNAKVPVPEWDGEVLMCCLETDILFSDNKATFLAPRQEKLHVL